MTALVGLTRLFGVLNAALLAAGRWLGVGCVALMVIFILVQVFFRYVLGNALPWSEEAARFLMLWMTGLMAPTAFRRGGFVSIDLVMMMLPRVVAALIQIVLLGLSLVVLLVGMRIGWAEVTGFGGRFATDALWVPLNFSFSEWMKVPRSWTMASLATGVTLLVSVNIELILRSLVQLFGGGDRLPAIPETATMGAE